MSGRDPADRGRSARFLRLLAAVSLMTALCHLTVLGVRLTHLQRKGDLIETTGTEVAPIYAVWKARHGHPVYVDPFTHDFDFSLYNWAFYFSYGLLGRIAGWDDAALHQSLRLLTCGLGLIGAAGFVVIVRRAAGRPAIDGAAALLVGSLAFLAWYSSSAWSWFAMSLRADMASMVLATTGLALYLRHLRHRSAVVVVLCGAAFFGAWAFKQSTLATLGGVWVHSVLRRSWKDAVLLPLPLVVGAAASLLLGGADYRMNVVTVPTFAAFNHLKESWQFLALLLGTHPASWLVPVVAAWTRQRWWRHISPDQQAAASTLALVMAVSAAWCLFALNRQGGHTNTLLEFYLAGSLAAAAILVSPACHHVIGDPRGARLAVVAILLWGALYPAAQLARPDRIANLTVTTAATHGALASVARVMRELPRPIFVEEGMLALPWHSTGGRYPAAVIDNFLYFSVRGRGRIPPERDLPRTIESRRFPALLLTGVTRLEPHALAAGYVERPLPDEAARLTRLRLFVLPADRLRSPVSSR